MPIDRITLHLVNMRLIAPFETSFGVEHDRQCVIVRVDADGLTGWGECPADRAASAIRTKRRRQCGTR